MPVSNVPKKKARKDGEAQWRTLDLEEPKQVPEINGHHNANLGVTLPQTLTAVKVL